MSIKPIYEFILWNNCNNNCRFCYQKTLNQNLTNDDKLHSLQKLKFKVNDLIKNKSHILFVGGEIFDSKDLKVNNSILSSYSNVINIKKNNLIDLVYINTNLIYDINECLVGVIDMFDKQNMIDSVKFTTSYDTCGRFNQYTEQLFRKNLFKIKDMFPRLNIVINTIMTNDFCESVLKNNIDFVGKCRNEFGCDVNLIPFINVNCELLPNRNDVFKVLLNMERTNPGYIRNYIDNFDLKQEKIIYKFNGEDYEYASSELSECGHGCNFKMYSTNGSCFICDLKELFKNG